MFSPRALLFLPVFLLTAAALHADPNPIDFSDPSSGFEAGSLKGQNNWKVSARSPANSDFVYEPGKGVLLTENTASSGELAYAFFKSEDTPEGMDDFPADSPKTFTINFILTQHNADVPRKGSIVGLGWSLFTPPGPTSMPIALILGRDSEAGGYQLRLSVRTKDAAIEGEKIAVIPESELGFKPGEAGVTSDPLQLSFTLINQGEKSEWQTIGMLTNLATQKAFVLKNTVSGANYYKTTELLRSFINARRRDADGLVSFTITEIDADVTPNPLEQ